MFGKYCAASIVSSIRNEHISDVLSVAISKTIWNSYKDFRYYTVDDLVQACHNKVYGYTAEMSEVCQLPNEGICRFCFSNKQFRKCCKEKHIRRIEYSNANKKPLVYCLDVITTEYLDMR